MYILFVKIELVIINKIYYNLDMSGSIHCTKQLQLQMQQQYISSTLLYGLPYAYTHELIYPQSALFLQQTLNKKKLDYKNKLVNTIIKHIYAIKGLEYGSRVINDIINKTNHENYKELIPPNRMEVLINEYNYDTFLYKIKHLEKNYKITQDPIYEMNIMYPHSIECNEYIVFIIQFENIKIKDTIFELCVIIMKNTVHGPLRLPNGIFDNNENYIMSNCNPDAILFNQKFVLSANILAGLALQEQQTMWEFIMSNIINGLTSNARSNIYSHFYIIKSHNIKCNGCKQLIDNDDTCGAMNCCNTYYHAQCLLEYYIKDIEGQYSNTHTLTCKSCNTSQDDYCGNNSTLLMEILGMIEKIT